jgi:hypothetical protein
MASPYAASPYAASPYAAPYDPGMVAASDPSSTGTIYAAGYGSPGRIAKVPDPGSAPRSRMPGHHYRPPTQPAGGPAPQYAYPYYTIRGPRDFLVNNPPSIGPY